MTTHQTETIKTMRDIAKRDGGRVVHGQPEDDGAYIVEYVQSSQWDHARTIYTMYPDGELIIW